MTAAIDLVVPTVGRPCLADLMGALGGGEGPSPLANVSSRRSSEGRPALGTTTS